MSSNDNTILYNSARVANFSVLLDDEPISDIDVSTLSISKPKIVEPKVVVPVTPAVDTQSSDGWSSVTKNSKKSLSNPHKATIRPSGSSTLPTVKPSFNNRTSSQHQNSHQHHHRSKPFIPPLQMDQLNESQTVEVYDFPSDWRTSDLKRLFPSLEYRLKWHSDNSCWFHFENEELCSKATIGVAAVINDLIEDLKKKEESGIEVEDQSKSSAAITEETLSMVKVRPFDIKNVTITTPEVKSPEQ